MNYIDIQEKTIELAIEKGLKELETTTENVEVTILKQPGMFSKAKVRLTIKEPQEKTTEINIDSVDEEVSQPAKEENTESVETMDKADIAISNEISTPAGKVLAKFCNAISPSITIVETENDHNIIYTLDGKNSDRIIGKGGQGIESLIIVLNAINRHHSEKGKHIVVRVAQYEITKEEKLKKLATQCADEAIKINNTVRLPIMNSYERRIVHAFLQADDRVVTESFGVEPYRYTTIRPKDKE